MRIAEFQWTTAPPTAVDEQLVLYDDGSAWLVVRRPRSPSPVIGSFVATVGDADRTLLVGAGPAPRVIDLLARDQPLEHLFPTLDRICYEARESPEAIATFAGRVAHPATGTAGVALIVAAAGRRPVEFELDPSKCATHFLANGQVESWAEFPELETGFITPDASGLGGLHRPAIITPETGGVVLVPLVPPVGADSFSLQVAGWLAAALPDDEGEAPFEVRTEPAPLST